MFFSLTLLRSLHVCTATCRANHPKADRELRSELAVAEQRVEAAELAERCASLLSARLGDMLRPLLRLDAGGEISAAIQRVGLEVRAKRVIFLTMNAFQRIQASVCLHFANQSQQHASKVAYQFNAINMAVQSKMSGAL
jgi:hypothetical protein